MEDDIEPSLWGILPEECKSVILSRLSNREAARIAMVSKEFDAVVKNTRDSVQQLVLPPDLSAAALQGFVASHKNLKSLSFRRCSAKVKRFLPIIEAAAGGKLDSKWYHRRSLEFVDFRSCGFLTDVDVNALCVLHSRLEDVNLANCCGISDVALTVLSRYRQSRPVCGDSSSEGPAKLLDETEVYPMPEILDSETIRDDPDNLWPELSSHAQSKISSKVTTGDVALGHSQSVGLVHSPPETFGRASVGENQNSNIKKPSRSYAQAALKAIHNYPHMVPSKSCRNNVDAFLPLAPISSTTKFVDITWEGLALPHIDWTSVQIPCRAVGTSDSSSNDSDLKFLWAPPTGDGLTVEDLKPGKLDFTRKKKRNKSALVDAMNCRTALPEQMDALHCDSATKRDFLLRDDQRLPLSRRLEKVVKDDDGKGMNYYRLDFESSGDRRLATRRSLHIPDSRASTSEAEYNKLVQDFKASKAVCVGGAKQVTDQRLDMSSHKSAKDRVEAFQTTHSDVGLFTISRENTSERRSDCSGVENPLQSSSLDVCKRSGKKGDSRLQDSTPLPAGLEGLQVGTTMKHGKHRDVAPELLDYQLETPIFFGQGDEENWKTRGLRSVSVAGCSDVTDKGVQALLRGPSKESLVSLDISRCSGVTSAGLRLPPISALEVLTAAQLPSIPRLLMQLSSEGSLRHLSLAACSKLDDLHLVAPHLQTLNVSNCKKLIRLQLKCPVLLSCNLSLCESLDTIARFTCGSLQSVNVYGCRLLRPAGFSTILDTAVSLREFRCGGCDRLERLEIPQLTLVRLEAQGCSSLRRLNVQSRLLKSVDACGSKNLTEVYLYSPNLRRMLFSNCALLQTLVIPLDAMKQSVDQALKNRGHDSNASQEGLEISISGCNVSESVQRNLARLSKQWKTTFAN